MSEFQKILTDTLSAFDIVLTENQLAQLKQYYELLIEWNEKMNLTALTAPAFDFFA